MQESEGSRTTAPSPKTSLAPQCSDQQQFVAPAAASNRCRRCSAERCTAVYLSGWDAPQTFRTFRRDCLGCRMDWAAVIYCHCRMRDCVPDREAVGMVGEAVLTALSCVPGECASQPCYTCSGELVSYCRRRDHLHRSTGTTALAAPVRVVAG